MKHRIWTIGHSTRDLAYFVDILHSFHIEMLVDIRSFPGSRRFPHFNKESLEISIPRANIEYEHMRELGGRRKVLKNSENTRWRLASFRGYADYMETNDFQLGIQRLEEYAREKNVAFMCAEAVWWSCHRSLVSDYLKANSWEVMHIMDIDKAEEHPYTKPARIVNGQLSYKDREKQSDIFEDQP